MTTHLAFRWRLAVLAGVLATLAVLLRPSAAAPTALDLALALTPAQVPAGSTVHAVLTVRGGTLPVTTTVTLPPTLQAATLPDGCQAASATTVQCAVAVVPAALDLPLTLATSAVPGSTIAVTSTATDVDGALQTASATLRVAAALPTPTPTTTATATPTAPPTATAPPTPGLPTATPVASAPPVTATPAVTPLPDAFEPNNTPDTAAPLPVGGAVDKLSFWPLGDVDAFLLVIKPSQAGFTLTVDTFVPFGLDTQLRLTGPDGTVVAENDDATPTEPRSHLAVVVGPGTYILEVVNLDPSRPDFKTYRLQTQLTAPASADPVPEPPTATPDPAATGDAWENNYDFDHAPLIPLGEPVGPLTFVCPADSPPGCADNDFFRLTVKPGRCYTAATRDVAAGLDPNLIVYGPRQDQEPPWSGNDDADPTTLASRTTFCAPPLVGPVDAYILIGNVGNRPPPHPASARTYTLQVDLADPPAPPTATPTVAPTAVPTAVPVGTALPAPIAPTAAVDPREVLREAAPTGWARITAAETTLYAAAPPAAGDALATYVAGDTVALLGQTYLGWVKVLPQGAVAPGWMWAPNLTVLDAATPAPTTSAAAPGTTPTAVHATVPGGSAANPTPAAALPAVLPAVTALPVVAATPSPVAPPVPEARTVRVRVCATTRTQRTTCTRALGQLTVMLVTAATGSVVGQAATDSDGQVTFTTSVLPRTQLVLVVPQVGIALPVAAADVPVYVPQAQAEVTP